jgi:hypothetical protein
MVTAFKEFLLPLLIYLAVLWACLAGVRGQPRLPSYLYLALLAFPQVAQAANKLPLGSMALSLLILCALWGSVWLRQPSLPEDGFSRRLMWIYLAYLGLSLGLAVSTHGAMLINGSAAWVFESWRNWVLTVLLYLVGYKVMQGDQDIKPLAILIAVVLLLMSVREFRNFYGNASFSYLRRAGETFSLRGLNANHFGAFVAYLAAFMVGLFAVDKRRVRWLYLAAVVAALYPLFFSYSRGAFAAFGLAALVVGMLRYRPLVVVALVVGIGWETLLPESVVDRILMTENESGELEESAALRLVVWKLAQDIFLDNPILGVGFQGFYFATLDLPLHNAHNYFLQTAAEQGAIGLMLVVLVLLRAMWVGWALSRTGATQLQRGFGMAVVALTITVAVANVFGDRFSLMELGSAFWFSFGAAQRLALAAKAAPPEGNNS